jgi:hypothetical protein
MFAVPPTADDVPHQHWIGKASGDVIGYGESGMSRQSVSIWFAAAVFTAVVLVQLAGCTRGETATPAAAAPAPSVTVATVV